MILGHNAFHETAHMTSIINSAILPTGQVIRLTHHEQPTSQHLPPSTIRRRLQRHKAAACSKSKADRSNPRGDQFLDSHHSRYRLRLIYASMRQGNVPGCSFFTL